MTVPLKWVKEVGWGRLKESPVAFNRSMGKLGTDILCYSTPPPRIRDGKTDVFEGRVTFGKGGCQRNGKAYRPEPPSLWHFNAMCLFRSLESNPLIRLVSMQMFRSCRCPFKHVGSQGIRTSGQRDLLTHRQFLRPTL